MLTVTTLFEDDLSSQNLKRDEHGFDWKKLAIPAAVIAGTGLLGYGGYQAYQAYQDYQNKQAVLGMLDNHIKNAEAQARELEKQYGVSEKDSFVNNNPARQLYNSLR